MDFGIFDHCERAGSRPAEVTYQERFKLAQHAERAGFYAYHLAEHHGTPFSLVPSPNLFLAALAQHTSTLRLGPLVHLLPMYDPYRLAEEICMMDGLCGGRLELGIGRGANPIELSFFGLNPQSAKERFDEAFPIMMQALTEGRIAHDGLSYKIPNAPLDVRPVQTPYPPIWYPSAGGGGSLAWAAQQGFNTIVNGPLASCIEAAEVYRDNFAAGPHGDAYKLGITRYVFVADTEEQAFRVGGEAFRYHVANLTKLPRDLGLPVTSPIIPPDDLRQAVSEGWAAAGTAAQVREQIGEIVGKVGVNYFVFAPMMAELSLEWGMRSIDLFKHEIMPALRQPAVRAA